jgi:tetratricopeptide (TPR) repeat protein
MPPPAQAVAASFDAALPAHTRPRAAWGKALPLPQHQDDFNRLRRLLTRSNRFALVIAQCGVSVYRDALIDAASSPTATRWQAPDPPEPDAMPEQLAEHAAGADALHLLGLDRWSSDDLHRLWRNLNVRRERLATELPLPFVLWLVEPQVRQLADQAPDLWAWRAAVLDFTPPGMPGGEAVWSEADESLLLDPEHTRERLRQLDAYLARQPDPEAYPDLLLETATRLAALGEAAAARAWAEQALRGFRAQGDDAGTALALMGLAQARRGEGRMDETTALLREAVNIAESALGDDHPTTAPALAELAQALEDAGEIAEAEQRLRHALAIEERVFGLGHPRVAQHLGHLGRILYATGRIDEAVDALDRAVGTLAAALDESDDVELRTQLARLHSNRGLAHADRGDLDAAIADYDAAIELRESLRSALGAQWPPKMQNDLAGVYSNRGAAHAGRGDLAAAIADHDAAIALCESLRSALGAQWSPEMQNDLAAAYLNLGAAYGQGGRFDEAIAELERAIALLHPLVEAHPDIPEWRSNLETAERNLALARRLAAGDDGG